ncbi:TPA: hypothetical protein MFM07_005311 [Klebsiella pneumoniae]|nr:hypothetical protein [Klebsiella pneumoniae]
MVGYRQTNQKTDTGKTLTRWPVFVDHFSVVGRMRDLILQLSKSSIYSTKP